VEVKDKNDDSVITGIGSFSPLVSVRKKLYIR